MSSKATGNFPAQTQKDWTCQQLVSLGSSCQSMVDRNWCSNAPAPWLLGQRGCDEVLYCQQDGAAGPTVVIVVIDGNSPCLYGMPSLCPHRCFLGHFPKQELPLKPLKSVSAKTQTKILPVCMCVHAGVVSGQGLRWGIADFLSWGMASRGRGLGEGAQEEGVLGRCWQEQGE